jgi:hypothetical protein
MASLGRKTASREPIQAGLVAVLNPDWHLADISMCQ